MSDIKLPPLVGSLLTLSPHMQAVVQAHGAACARTAVEADKAARVPMTDDGLIEGFCSAPHSNQFVSVFIAGARFAERQHGIGKEQQ